MKDKFNKELYEPSDEEARKQREEFWNAKRTEVYRKNMGYQQERDLIPDVLPPDYQAWIDAVDGDSQFQDSIDYSKVPF